MGGKPSPPVSKWVTLVAGLLLLACAGLSFNFAIYSSKLKTILGYSQIQIQLLATAKDIGDNVGIAAGILSAFLPTWAMLLIGAMQNSFGYSMMYLIASRRISQPPFWQVFLFFLIGVNSSTYFTTAALTTSVPAFNLSRGIVTGMLSAMIGLSGAIFGQVYYATLAPNQIAFLLIAAMGPTAIALSAIPLIKRANFDTVSADLQECTVSHEESSNLRFLSLVFFSLAGYLMTEALISSFLSLSKLHSQIITAAMLIILSLPFYVPIKTYFKSTTQPNTVIPEPHSLPHTGPQDSVPIYPGYKAQTAENSAPLLPGKRRLRPRRGEDFSLAEGLVKADFWLLFVSVLCAAGSGLTAMNNLAQIGEAQGSGDVKIAVSLVSIWNYMGRVIGGFYSEHLVRRHGLPRPAILVGCHAAMALGHFMFAFAVPGSVYLGSLVVGTGFGTTMAMVPTVASELFGLRNFGMFYNVFTSALPVGSYLFSGLLAGYVYDREAQKEAGQGLGPAGASLAVGPGGGKVACHGAHCFKLTFLVMAAICVVATLADVLLVVRTFPVYRRLYPREEDMQEEEEEGNM